MGLNIKNMRKWVKALRSGKYSQTRGKLKRGKDFCCLGVACDISGVGSWSGDRYNNMELNIIPKNVQKFLGIKTGNPALRDGRSRTSAAAMNDAKLYTFDQIADAIERTWPQIKYKKSKRFTK